MCYLYKLMQLILTASCSQRIFMVLNTNRVCNEIKTLHIVKMFSCWEEKRERTDVIKSISVTGHGDLEGCEMSRTRISYTIGSRTAVRLSALCSGHALPLERPLKKKLLWPESVSKLYQPSDHRLSAKLVPTFADIGYHMVSITDPYSRTVSFLDRT
jgi:hypothetical protein